MTSEKPAAPVMRDAAYFDQWYADMATSSARDAIVARTMGLPPISGSQVSSPGRASPR